MGGLSWCWGITDVFGIRLTVIGNDERKILTHKPLSVCFNIAQHVIGTDDRKRHVRTFTCVVCFGAGTVPGMNGNDIQNVIHMALSSFPNIIAELLFMGSACKLVRLLYY